MKQTESIKTRMTITQNWEAKIKAKGLSIVKLSLLSGVTRTTIYGAIKGDNIPRFSTINKVEEVLNADFLDIPKSNEPKQEV